MRVQVRDCYSIWLKGTKLENPGWDEALGAVLGALARLVGKKPQHVPEALTTKQTAEFLHSITVGILPVELENYTSTQANFYTR